VLQPLQVKNSKMPGSNDRSGFPVIEIKRDPAFKVDQCGDITLDVSDTKNTGGWINVTWELL
jgi:hypothetical protein